MPLTKLGFSFRKMNNCHRSLQILNDHCNFPDSKVCSIACHLHGRALGPSWRTSFAAWNRNACPQGFKASDTSGAPLCAPCTFPSSQSAVLKETVISSFLSARAWLQWAAGQMGAGAREWSEVSRAQLFATPCNIQPMEFSQNIGVGSLSLLQGIFQTQGSNPGFLYCWRFLYQLSHKGSPTILEWVAYPLSSRCSRLRRLTRVSCIAGGFFTNWATREAPVPTEGTSFAFVDKWTVLAYLVIMSWESSPYVSAVFKNLPNPNF